MRRWVLPALLASLLLHAALLVYFHFQRLENFGGVRAERLAPRVEAPRVLFIADLPPAESQSVEVKRAEPVSVIRIPETKPQVAEEFFVKPDAPTHQVPVVMELDDRPVLGKLGPDPSMEQERQMGALASSLVETSVPAPSQPRIRVGSKAGQGGMDDEVEIPGRLSLARALGNLGGITSGKAIAMHGGALFEWGRAELRPEAAADLRMLGEVMKHFPTAIILISGHTDHTGTREPNLILSLERANAVRDWLVANLGLDPARIRTVGRADDEALPNLGPEKSIEEQAPNRRVEILVQTRGE